jgi:UDP-N-acetylmuramoyl-L-alanyl-D-glutamate--2,6-diaminopimelate ligase
MLLAVTGTNGKTTTTWLLEAMCAAGGAATGRIGTIDTRFAGRSLEPTHTTPDALALHALLREMVDAGTDTVVMEVSSHALDQERVAGLTFRAAALTNLSRDHLDYHPDMESYFQAKRKLFSDNLSPGGVAVVNGDDTYAVRIYNEVRGSKRMAWKFSRTGGEISAAGVEYSLAGIKATLKTPAGDIPIQSALVGPHNLENILAAAGMALGAGFSRQDVKDGISRVTRVPGRMERIEAKGLVALVDYAHSDDALKRSLEAARTLARGRVVVVFGCGGDRTAASADGPGGGGERRSGGRHQRQSPDEEPVGSSGRSPGVEEGRAAADERREGQERREGLPGGRRRRAAIELGSRSSGRRVLLVAGKGHEAVQIIGTEKKPFDDVAEARAALAKIAGA